ncbi:glycerol acyltransferase [Oxalobacteraceae bacterium OM1]|nr:glycerol acyltransferase [Oxalobacteraceae bacterium OM1]
MSAKPDFILEPAALPTRWQRFSARVLRLIGWRVRFAPLPGPCGVVVVYPHTSNWDFVIGLFAKWTIGVRFRWLGKEALFRGVSGALLGPFLRAWGGIPVERGVQTGAIPRLAQDMRAGGYWLALAPEGTRKYRPGWRSGFYHIAVGADVPLGMACIDYAKKEVRLVDYLQLSGDVERDMAAVRAVFPEACGYRPECAAPITLVTAKDKKAA